MLFQSIKKARECVWATQTPHLVLSVSYLPFLTFGGMSGRDRGYEKNLNSRHTQKEGQTMVLDFDDIFHKI